MDRRALTVSNHDRICTDLKRLPGLDALRAVATLLVVALHAAIPYLLHSLPGLPWPIRDAVCCRGVDALFWWIEGFIMPLFFTLSGFLAAQLLLRQGPECFVRRRARRLLVPLFVAGAIILPVDLYIWLLGWVADGQLPPAKLRSLKLDGDHNQVWGLAHLWFLQYLFVYCLLLATAAARWKAWTTRLGGRFDRFRGPAAGLASPWLPMFVAVPCGLLLTVSPETVLGFQHGFLPVPIKFLHGGLFFAVGGLLFVQRPSREQCMRWAAAYFALSLPLFAVLLPCIHGHLAADADRVPLVLLAGGLGLFAALSVCGLFGLALRIDRPAPASLTYIAEASFWIYLVHHPLVALMQVDLGPFALSAALKFLIVFSLATGLSLASYHVLVRRTRLAAALADQPVQQPSRTASPPGLKFPPPENDRARKAA